MVTLRAETRVVSIANSAPESASIDIAQISVTNEHVCRDSVPQTRGKDDREAKGREGGNSRSSLPIRLVPGCECVPHILQTVTDLDPETTIMSIDGMGAYDLISRNAMLESLLQMEGGDQILPIVRCFYGSPSTHLWEDDMGTNIPQGEGGDQGDPLMPMLFALGQHRALPAIQERLTPGEHVMAFRVSTGAVGRYTQRWGKSWPRTPTSTCTMASPSLEQRFYSSLKAISS